MSKKKYSSLYRQENQQKQCWSSDSNDSKEEFQHANFVHVRFSQRTYHCLHWKFDSSGSDDVSKAVWDRERTIILKKGQMMQ